MVRVWKRPFVVTVLVFMMLGQVAPPADAAFGFRITVSAPEVVIVDDAVRITGMFKNGLVPAARRAVWLMHDDGRIAEGATSVTGSFSFFLAWPVPGAAELHVRGDPFGPLDTRSPPFTVTGLSAPGDPPEDVLVEDPAWGEVSVSWRPGIPTPGAEQEAWRVYRAPQGTDSWHLVGEVGADVLSLGDTVDTGTWYVYEVRGWNRLGEGAPHTKVHRTAGPNATAVSPASLEGTEGASWRRLVLEWPFPDEPLGHEVEAFRVYRRPAQVSTLDEVSEWAFIGEVPRPVTTFEDRIDAEGVYDYAVAGWNRHGEGPWVTASFGFTEPPADGLWTEVERVRVCTSGRNAGVQCWDAVHGGLYHTYDDGKVSAMVPVSSFALRLGATAVAEAPVDLELEFKVVCSETGCPEATRSKTVDTGFDGDGAASFDFGAFADPVDTCYTYEAVVTARYHELIAGDPMRFRICD